MSFVKPNLVVGVVGLVVFLLTANYMADNWRTLTEIKDWSVDVETHHQPVEREVLAMQSGTSSVVPYSIPVSNVYHVFLRVTWDESGSLNAQHDVTVIVRNAQGVQVDQKTGHGGLTGLTFDLALREVPTGSSFDGTDDQAASEYEDRYPEHTEDRGTWNVAIQANRPTNPGTGGLTVTLSFEYDYYTVGELTEREVPLR